MGNLIKEKDHLKIGVSLFAILTCAAAGMDSADLDDFRRLPPFSSESGSYTTKLVGSPSGAFLILYEGPHHFVGVRIAADGSLIDTRVIRTPLVVGRTATGWIGARDTASGTILIEELPDGESAWTPLAILPYNGFPSEIVETDAGYVLSITERRYPDYHRVLLALDRGGNVVRSRSLLGIFSSDFGAHTLVSTGNTILTIEPTPTTLRVLRFDSTLEQIDETVITSTPYIVDLAGDQHGALLLTRSNGDVNQLFVFDADLDLVRTLALPKGHRGWLSAGAAGRGAFVAEGASMVFHPISAGGDPLPRVALKRFNGVTQTGDLFLFDRPDPDFYWRSLLEIERGPGSPAGATVDIGSLTPPRVGQSELVPGSNTTLFTWISNGRTFAQMIDSEGKAMPGQPLGFSDSNNSLPQASLPDGDGFLVAWIDPNGLGIARVDSSGTIVARRQIPHLEREGFRSVRLARANGEVRVFWSWRPPNEQSDDPGARVATLNDDLSLRDVQPLTLADRYGSWDYLELDHVSFDQGSWVIVWTHTNISPIPGYGGGSYLTIRSYTSDLQPLGPALSLLLVAYSRCAIGPVGVSLELLCGVPWDPRDDTYMLTPDTPTIAHLFWTRNAPRLLTTRHVIPGLSHPEALRVVDGVSEGIARTRTGHAVRIRFNEGQGNVSVERLGTHAVRSISGWLPSGRLVGFDDESPLTLRVLESGRADLETEALSLSGRARVRITNPGPDPARDILITARNFAVTSFELCGEPKRCDLPPGGAIEIDLRYQFSWQELEITAASTSRNERWTTTKVTEPPAPPSTRNRAVRR